MFEVLDVVRFVSCSVMISASVVCASCLSSSCWLLMLLMSSFSTLMFLFCIVCCGVLMCDVMRVCVCVCVCV